MTPAVFELLLSPAWHFPVDLLDNFSSVWPSRDRTVGRITVELDSVAQQTGGVSNDPWNDWSRDVDLDLQRLFQSSSYRPDLSFHQPNRNLNCTDAG